MNREDIQMRCDRVPFFRFLDFIVSDLIDEGIETIMPFSERHIGNPVLNYVHGGIVASFLEATAMLSVMENWEGNPPKPINLTVDYLRPSKSEQLNARAVILRKGRRMASVEAVAWQDDEQKLVAKGLFHFLVV